jgi:hypothetical protein
MRTIVKRFLMGLHCRGLLPAAAVTGLFRWLDLARH